jgi:hypothetical protein
MDELKYSKGQDNLFANISLFTVVGLAQIFPIFESLSYPYNGLAINIFKAVFQPRPKIYLLCILRQTTHNAVDIFLTAITMPGRSVPRPGRAECKLCAVQHVTRDL